MSPRSDDAWGDIKDSNLNFVTYGKGEDDPLKKYVAKVQEAYPGHNVFICHQFRSQFDFHWDCEPTNRKQIVMRPMLLWWSTKYPCGGQVTNYKKDLQKWPWNGYGDKHELVDGGKVVNFFALNPSCSCFEVNIVK